jgi:homoserine kinase
MCSREAAATAPATVSNVCCGFDVLGFALEAPADIVTARKTAAAGVSVAGISGDGGRLPRDPERNTAAVAAAALLRVARGPEGLRHHDGPGVELVIRKGLPLASGIGSSGASAVAAVLAVNAALGLDASPDQLLWSAMQGERAAAGSPHPDNVAPSLLGGFVLARSSDPPDLVRLPVPRGLACVVLHPALEVETSAARAILPASVPLADAVRQWANVGALVAALYSGDLDLLGRAMVDHIVEPRRAHLVPGFAAVVRAARDAGAIGSGLSGAGPSIFALCRSRDDAHRAGGAMLAALRRDGGVEGTLYVSPVATSGARLVDAVV